MRNPEHTGQVEERSEPTRALGAKLDPLPVADEYRRRFRALVEEHGPGLARTLRYLGVADAELDDAVQEVFVVAHRRWSDLSHDESIGGWLRGVAVNVARGRKRAARRSPIGPHVPELEVADPSLLEERLAERERCRQLLTLLDALPDEQRTALVLFEIEAVPVKQIAEVLSVSVPTAYRRVEDARAALRRALDKEQR